MTRFDVTRDPSSFPRVFKCDGQFRRSCLYLILGGWTCMGLAIYVRLLLGNPLDGSIALLSLAFGIGPVALWAYVETYRLRLDEWGLSRRRLGIWSCWPWEAFSQGKVTVDRQKFTFGSRPIWDRWITTAFLPDADGAFVQEIVKSVVPAECRLEGRRLRLAQEVSEVTLGLVVMRKLRVTKNGCE